MKASIHSIKKTTIFLCGLFFFSLTVQAQKEKKQNTDTTAIRQVLESKEYIFKAQSVSPIRGGFRQLTSDYDLRVFGDTLISYLPYFGRSYSAPVNNNEVGIQFTSLKFKHDLQTRKKGWDVTLKPMDVSNVQQMLLNVTTTGKATLQVISNNKEPISFSGYIISRH